jgi:hypothetical protein
VHVKLRRKYQVLGNECYVNKKLYNQQLFLSTDSVTNRSLRGNGRYMIQKNCVFYAARAIAT